jgi:hypothetical protein
MHFAKFFLNAFLHNRKFCHKKIHCHIVTAIHVSPFVYGVYFLGPNFHWFFKLCKMQIKWFFGVSTQPNLKVLIFKKKNLHDA